MRLLGPQVIRLTNHVTIEPMSYGSDAEMPALLRNRKVQLLAVASVLACAVGAVAVWKRGHASHSTERVATASLDAPVVSAGAPSSASAIPETVPDALRAMPLEATVHVANPNLFVVRFAGEIGIAIGSDGAVLRSTDAGRRWLPAVTTTDQPLSDVVIYGTTVIAVGAKGTILTSSDGGQRFTSRSWGGTEELRAVIRAPSGRFVAVGDHGVVLASKDGGQTWQREDADTGAFLGHVLATSSPEQLIAAGEHGSVVSSHGDGKWRVLPTGTDAVITAVEACADGVLLAATEAGPVLRSKDGGETWAVVRVSEAEGVFATAFASDPAGHVTVAVTRGGEIWTTTDRGASWTVSRLSGAKFLGPVTFMTKNAGFIVGGDDGTIWISDPTGQGWTATMSTKNAQIESLAVEPKTGSIIAVGRGGAVFRSTDGGKSWTTVKHGIVDYANAVSVSPSGKAVIAVGPHGSLSRSTDGGRSYVAVTAPVEDTVTFFATAVHVKTGAMLAGGNGNTLIRSNDEGAHWERTQGASRNIGGFHVHSDGTVLAFTIDEGVLRSTDGGQTWTDTDVPHDVGIASAVSPKAGGSIGVGRRGVVFGADDVGTHFTAYSSGTDADLNQIVEDPRSNTLWAVGTRGVLLASTDRGRSWRVVASNTSESLNRILVHPKSGHLLVVGNRGVILSSRDAGRSFQSVPSGTAEHLRTVEIEPKTGRFVVAGKNGVVLVSDDGLRFQAAASHSLSRFSTITSLDGALVLAGDRLIRWQLGAIANRF
ncbi:MAG: YCF48-related protein [Polyangiaceae bacterium]